MTLFNKSHIDLSPEDFVRATAHIDKTWDDLERYLPHDEGTFIGLPHPYIVPSLNTGHFSFQEMYYWDSFFIAQGLYGTRKASVAEGMLENLFQLLNRFGIIPNGNRFYHTAKSQPPLLTSYIFDVYTNHHKSIEWLEDKMMIAKKEYAEVWMGSKHPVWHKVFHGLSRYYHYDILHDLAETESGWDMNPRFYRQGLSYIPIDLNCLLYKYEMDFAKVAGLTGNNEESSHWQQKAWERQDTINKYLWNSHEGFYFDYNFERQEQGGIWSLAPYFAMWTHMATEKQAAQLVEHLKKFEFEGGLATCAADQDMKIHREVLPPMQWDYPNGWAPLHWIVIEGLKKYGYMIEAERIAKKWLATNLTYFDRTGTFIEKYNVVDPTDEPLDGVYPTQIGFGWTNGIFYRLGREYGFIDDSMVPRPHKSHHSRQFA